MTLELRLAESADLPSVYALRHDVFVVGQQVPEDLERDEYDDGADHAVASVDGVVLATGRLLAPLSADAPARIGRMAVAEAARGRGLGAAVLHLLECRAAERGWRVIELHAQVHACAFYERAGYVAFGTVYLDAGIEHLSMTKTLSPIGSGS